jgi:hypothetical protein
MSQDKDLSGMPLSPRDLIDVERQFAISQMQRHFPGTRLHEIGEIGYRSDSRSPIKINRQAGFLPDSDQAPAVSRTDRFTDNGMTDFSLVPEVAAINAWPGAEGRRYIYAVPIDKGYLVNNERRQVMVPALESDFFVAREILSNDGHTATLGKPIVYGQAPEASATDVAFQNFLKAPSLSVPQDIALGDENYPAHYDVKDTPASARIFSR